MSGYAWRAGKDGIAHASKGRAVRVACDAAAAVPERYAWPAERRCEACVAVVNESVSPPALFPAGWHRTPGGGSPPDAA